MNYSNKRDNLHSTITTHVVCAVFFCLFSLAWLSLFQCDLLTVAQHVWSGGQTHYNAILGPSIITFALFSLQQVVFRVVGLAKRSHALTYLPSMMLLAMISDINLDTDGLSLYWIWLFPLVLILWGGAVWIARQAIPFDFPKEQTGLFSRRLWGNVLQMVIMILAVVGLSNTNAVAHYRAHAEVAIAEGHLDEALRVGKASEETDIHLTMLRAYALSQKGLLGECLFEYPIVGRSDDLLPFMKGRSRLLLLSRDSVYHHLGARPVAVSDANRYFDLLEKKSLASPSVADYRLCGCLIDKKLDDFVRRLTTYYSISDSLPKYYREALTLYTHKRLNPVIIYHDEVMDEDWKNFQELQKKYSLASERRMKIAERYKESYWYYFYYCD